MFISECTQTLWFMCFTCEAFLSFKVVLTRLIYCLYSKWKQLSFTLFPAVILCPTSQLFKKKPQTLASPLCLLQIVWGAIFLSTGAFTCKAHLLKTVHFTRVLQMSVFTCSVDRFSLIRHVRVFLKATAGRFQDETPFDKQFSQFLQTQCTWMTE